MVELTLETDSPSGDSVSSVLCRFGPEVSSLVATCEAAGQSLAAMLRVDVVSASTDSNVALPSVAGHHDLVSEGLRFTPLMPFERGVPYRARFVLSPGCEAGWDVSETIEFRQPQRLAVTTPEVLHIYPSSDTLPENLLRFYVSFSHPMQRGHCEREVTLRDANGRPVLDALYRAPVELWDGTMRHLTVLLDPGRLKRHLGPHAALGPPMQEGEVYELEIGAGMTDINGNTLGSSVRKRFHATAPVRAAVDLGEWAIEAPRAESQDALLLRFPRPLDWALLLGSIKVETVSGTPVEGRVEVSCAELQAQFLPSSEWIAGAYTICVATSLEDVCGNDLLAPFDRPYRPDSHSSGDVPFRTVPFFTAPPV